jgi:ankyrin repeat protein
MDFFINNMYTSNEGKLRVRGFGLTSADASRLTKDADSNIQNSDEEKGRLFHHLMRYRKWDEAIEFIDRLALIDKAVAVNRKDRINVTTLMRAAVYGAPFTVIQRFCEIGGKALILARSDDGWTALHWACDRTNPNFQVVTYLVQNGGEKLVNKQDNRGRFALDLIRSDPTNENVRIFLQNFHGESSHHAICLNFFKTLFMVVITSWTKNLMC